MKKKNVYVAKTIWGKELDKKNKQMRIRSYLIESTFFGIGMTLIETIIFTFQKLLDTIHFTSNSIINVTLTLLSSFVIAFIVFFAFNYLVSELSLKRYNKGSI